MPGTKNQKTAARIALDALKHHKKLEPGTASASMAKMGKKELEKFAKGKPKKESADVGQEFDNQVGDMYAVQRPYDGCDANKLVHKIDPLQGVQGIGVEPVQIYGAYLEEKMAVMTAEKLCKEFSDTAMMLEKKKQQVADKLKEAIDQLEARRTECVGMIKENPKESGAHKETIAQLATKIDDLMTKLEKIEHSKKEIENKEDKKKDKKKSLKESSFNIGDNLKVGDKFVKKDKQVLTIQKIVGDQVYLESDRFEGKLWQWPKEIFDADVKSGELRWQPMQKESLEESRFEAEMGKTITGDTTVIVKKDGKVLSREEQLELSDKEQEEIIKLKKAAVENARFRSKTLKK